MWTSYKLTLRTWWPSSWDKTHSRLWSSVR